MRRSLRERVRKGERLIGVLLRMPAEETVEMASTAGIDFVLIDCEHGPADVTVLRQHIAAAQVNGTPVIVRTGERDDRLALRALDQGAEGLLGPHLDDVTDAHSLVSAAMYPPVGQRGFATYSRAGRFGAVDSQTHRDWYLENTLLLGMIESPLGVANVDEIVGVERLDGIMVGPSDLLVTSTPQDLSVGEAMKKVNATLRRQQKIRLDIVGSREKAEAAFADGAQMVVYNLAAVMMTMMHDLVGGVPTRN